MRPCIALLFLFCILQFGARAAASGLELHGAPLPPIASVPLAKAAADLPVHAGTARNFSGRITEVCQNKGCWVMLEDQGITARVMLGDHQFTVPAHTRGPALVHGVLSRHALSPDAADHLEADAGGRKLAARDFEYRILASGMQVQLAD